MASCPSPQILRHLLERSRRKAVLRSAHARSHCFDLKLAGLDEGGYVKIAILAQGFVGSLGEDVSG